MKIYGFWNNKGGTGKTSLAFQALIRYAEMHTEEQILVIDACPQANLSELLLGGLIGNGSSNLVCLHQDSPRKSIGGYFQSRLPSPYTIPTINPDDYLSHPNKYNPNIPKNIDLLAGDPLVELQANAMATLANTQIPVTDTWLKVIDWLKDFIGLLKKPYQAVFIDNNPSFSIYTQIALSTAEKLVLPVMADDSSRRAIQNVFSLVHGINLPSSIYGQYSFTTKLQGAGRTLPKIHLIVKNRITQYMGPASAYSSVLLSIIDLVQGLLKTHPSVFTFTELPSGTVDVRDFQTTGVVAFAEGTPFSKLKPGTHNIGGKSVQIAQNNIQLCLGAVDDLVRKL